ncbi:MAG: HAMP domain-containing histidine kinase [Anaerolineae bacterium]|nr:HAMP domain-containing histidine kinase [Anaerolineae bacterium]
MTNRIIDHDTLANLCNNLFEAVIAIDQERRICLFNHAAEATFNLPMAEVLGTQLTDHPVLQSLVPLADWVIATDEFARQEFTLESGARRWVQMFVASENVHGQGKVKLAARKDSTNQAADPMREIVHDLKVRIASAKSFIDLVEASGDLNASQQKFAQRAHLSLVSMLSQVHEILDMTWLDSGGKLERVQTDLNDLIQRAVMHQEGYAVYANIDITLDLPPDGCVLQGDERRLSSAIGNLVSNAIKYSPDGGPVIVRLVRENRAITLSVQDHGLGIAAEFLPNIFQRFYRVRTPQTRRIEGSGLGLAIVKAIVEKHGGTVFVQSVEGAGSTFGFTLPAP